MKLSGKAMMAVAMILGAMAALTGCKSNEQSKADEAAPVAQPAPVAAAEAPAAQTEAEHTTIQASTKVAVGPLPPMPAPRFENPGRAPSRDHLFVKGFWRLDNQRSGYVWVPGHWQAQHAPTAPPAPRYENPGRPPSDKHVFVPGYHRWTGHDYKWVAGHWDIKRGGATYVGAHWEKIDGRYRYVPGRWTR